MKAKPGFVVRHYNYGIGYRIQDPTDEVFPQVNGLIELTEKELYMWEVMQEEFTKESLTEKVIEKFGDSPEDAAAQVEKLVETLITRKLIDGAPPRFPGMPN